MLNQLSDTPATETKAVKYIFKDPELQIAYDVVEDNWCGDGAEGALVIASNGIEQFSFKPTRRRGFDKQRNLEIVFGETV